MSIHPKSIPPNVFKKHLVQRQKFSRHENYFVTNLENIVPLEYYWEYDFEELVLWCMENCKHKWYFNFENFQFENKLEATLFALVVK